MTWTVEKLGFNSWQVPEILLFIIASILTGTHQASYSIGTGALSLWVKQQGHEADPSLI
jgi:hypothetical protein